MHSISLRVLFLLCAPFLSLFLPLSTYAVTPLPDPHLSSLAPSSGPVGTMVTLTGTGFTPSANTLHIGSKSLSPLPDEGVVPNLSSSDGKTLIFSFPSSLAPACTFQIPACKVPERQVIPGSYLLSVSNANGSSNQIEFRVTSPSPFFQGNQTLKRGSQGQAVSDLQKLLSSLGRGHGRTSYGLRQKAPLRGERGAVRAGRRASA